MIVVGKDAPCDWWFGACLQQCFAKTGHAFRAVSDVREVIETSGSEMIENISLLIVGRAMPRTSEMLAEFQNFRALFRGELAP